MGYCMMSTYYEHGTLTVDLHDMEVSMAARYLKKAVDQAPPRTSEIVVIHGYRQGQALMHYVRRTFTHRRLRGKRLGLNRGVTYLILEI